MYPVREYRGSPYVRSVSEFAHSVEQRIPTLTRTLDRYFDVHFEEIIEEWQLLTDYELRDTEHRLEKVSAEITNLYKEKETLEERAAALDAELKELEGME